MNIKIIIAILAMGAIIGVTVILKIDNSNDKGPAHSAADTGRPLVTDRQGRPLNWDAPVQHSPYGSKGF